MPTNQHWKNEEKKLFEMEAFLTSRVAAVGLDEEAFVPYIAGLCAEHDEERDGPLVERIRAALEAAGAEECQALAEAVAAFRAGEGARAAGEEERKMAEAREAAARALEASRVLRGAKEGAGDAREVGEGQGEGEEKMSGEERRRKTGAAGALRCAGRDRDGRDGGR